MHPTEAMVFVKCEDKSLLSALEPGPPATSKELFFVETRVIDVDCSALLCL